MLYAIYISDLYLGCGYFRNTYTYQGEIGYIALTKEIEKAKLYKQRGSAEKKIRSLSEIEREARMEIREVKE